MRLKRFLLLAIAIVFILPHTSLEAHCSQEDEDDVERLMRQMSTTEKVGQLFLVSFEGTDVAADAAITELIRDYHIGGVVLSSSNGNINNEGDTPTQVAELVSQLQRTTWFSTRPTTETVGSESLDGTDRLPPPGPFIPLFIAVNHEGNGMPFTSIINGMTPLPSAMALGATWNPAHAESVGQIAGQELRALGVTMLLGPSLDVLENPRPESAGNLGVRSFGGEPFWVGRMGQAYIQGVHDGSEQKVAVIAKHFPGLGSSDRSLAEEIPTVQRTLEKLRQIDLAPFFAVAQAEDPLSRPDGILVSHIRFRGLEGDRFATTRPVSVDNQLLQRLLGSPELSLWRDDGGVVVSDELGLRGLQRFYDPTGENFNNRLVAKEAFIAGNDLLILSQFALSEEWDDHVANIKSTLAFFEELYDNDASFQSAVDNSVARILRLKLTLHDGRFTLATTSPEVERVSQQVGLHLDVLPEIGRDAITLLSPPSADLVPAPPTPEDNIVLFTDSMEGQPCSRCEPVPYIDPTAPQETIVRLYGPSGTRQVSVWRTTRFTFDQLEEYLNVPAVAPAPTPVAEGEEGGGEPTGEQENVNTQTSYLIGQVLQQADWVIFTMIAPAEDQPQSDAVGRFLAERADALRDPRLVVLAYDAPYYLDATEISKLSAYYVTYSRIEPFIEESLRSLFGEFAPGGTAPVSVSGINYDLETRISPDPDQAISVLVGDPRESQEPTPGPLQLQIEDEIDLHTSIIVDHNGQPVPDGTPIQFVFAYLQEGLEHSTTATTLEGVAKTTYTLERAGQLDIAIQADPVPRTVSLQITIQEGQPATIVPVLPTPRPTRTPAPTSTLLPESVAEDTPPPPATFTPAGNAQPVEGETEGGSEATAEEATLDARPSVGLSDLALALAVALTLSGGGFYVARSRNRPVASTLRSTLWCVAGGLAFYVAYALALPGVAWLQRSSRPWSGGWAALVGSATSLLIGWIAGSQEQMQRRAQH